MQGLWEAALMDERLAETTEELAAKAYLDLEHTEAEWLDSCAALDSILARLDAVTKAGNVLFDTVVWMSGSPSFSPEGEANEGWLKAREKAYEAKKVLDG